MLTSTTAEPRGYTCRGKVTTKGNTYNIMVMVMESSYIEENGGHVKTQLAEEIRMVYSRFVLNVRRIDKKPCDHEPAAHTLAAETKDWGKI